MIRYLFSVFGVVAGLATIFYATHKKNIWLKLCVLTSVIAFVSCGAPLDDSGHFIWQCHQKDENGLT